MFVYSRMPAVTHTHTHTHHRHTLRIRFVVRVFSRIYG